MIYIEEALNYIPDYRTTQSPEIGAGRGQLGTDQSSIQHLEGELEQAQNDVAEKPARMRVIPNFIEMLTGT